MKTVKSILAFAKDLSFGLLLISIAFFSLVSYDNWSLENNKEIAPSQSSIIYKKSADEITAYHETSSITQPFLLSKKLHVIDTEGKDLYLKPYLIYKIQKKEKSDEFLTVFYGDGTENKIKTTLKSIESSVNTDYPNLFFKSNSILFNCLYIEEIFFDYYHNGTNTTLGIIKLDNGDRLEITKNNVAKLKKQMNAFIIQE